MYKLFLLALSIAFHCGPQAKAELKIQDLHSDGLHISEQNIQVPLGEAVPTRQQVQELFDRGSLPTVRAAGAWAGTCYDGPNGSAVPGVLVFFKQRFSTTFEVFTSSSADQKDPYYFDKLNPFEGMSLARKASRSAQSSSYTYSAIFRTEKSLEVARARSGHTCSLKIRQSGEFLTFSWDDGLDYCLFRKRIDRF